MTERIKELSNSALLDLLVKFFVLALVPWMIWATTQIYHIKGFMGEGERFSTRDAKDMEMRMQKERHEQELRIMLILKEFESEFTREFLRKDEVPK